MKKYLYSIFAAVLAVGCTSFEEEQPLAVETVDAPTITVVKVEDTSVTATITAVEGTSFYSYAVIAGKAAELDATTLFKLGYKSKAVANGTVNFSKTPAFELVAGTAEKPLTRDADYTIYAVAASEQGTIGEVVYKEFHTSDALSPSVGGASAVGNVATLKFSEKVTYDTSKPATAKYYAEKLVKLNGDKSDLASDGYMGDAKVVVEVAADGKSANFTVTLEDGSPLPNGAIYSVSYPEGAFKDNVENPIAGLTSGPVAKSSKIAWSGLVAQIATKPFALVPDEEDLPNIADLSTPITYSVPEDVTLFSYDKTMKGMVLYQGSNYETVYEVANVKLLSATQIAVLPYVDGMNAPARGEYIALAVPEKYLTDIYGNTSEAITIGPVIYSYGYKLEDFTGTYTFAATAQYGGAQAEASVVIAPDPEDEDYLMIYNLFKSTTCLDDIDSFEYYGEPLYATFNVDNGIVNVEMDAIGEGAIAKYNWAGDVLALAFDYDDNSFDFQMPAVGTLELQNVVYLYLDGLGWWDLYAEGTLTRISEDYTIPTDEEEAPITIDGDMSDWDEIEGVETPDAICKVMKVTNDDNYFYVYLASAPGSRGSQLWGNEAGYYYLDFDWDNNAETGIAENSNPGFDCWCYLYIFGGSAEAPIIKEHPNGSGTEMSIANITAKGVITDELIEIELSIPRADMVDVAAGTETRILSWRSKDGTKITQTYTVK